LLVDSTKTSTRFRIENPFLEASLCQIKGKGSKVIWKFLRNDGEGEGNILGEESKVGDEEYGILKGIKRKKNR